MLGNHRPSIPETENEVDEQAGYAFNASSFGEDPQKAIEDAKTRIRVYYEPLRQEDLITRRLTATTAPIYVRKGLDLNPQLP